MKGPVSGANCDIFAVNASGVAESMAQASAISGATGSVTFADVNFEGTGLVSCTGGTYTDESTGQSKTAPTLRSVVTVVEGTTEDPAPSYIVSPLTEMAVQAAGSDLTAFAAEAAEINGRFGIRFDITQVQPTIVGVDALGVQGAADADRYGSVLALLSQLDADDANKDMATLISDIVTDLADGTFSDATLDVFETAQTNLQTTSQVASAVDQSLLDVIGSAVGYNNDPVTAILEGDLSGTVQNTVATAITGKVLVTDPNFEEEAIVPQTDVALVVGERETDTFTIQSNDNSTAELVITITGTVVVNTGANNVAVIIDTDSGDTGELRYKIGDDGLAQGKMTAKIKRLDDELGDGDAFITLYNSSTSNSGAILDLRIKDDSFSVRDSSVDASVATVLLDQFMDVEITWEYPGGDTSANPVIKVSIDGVAFATDGFTTTSSPVGGVTHIAFRFGDNSRVMAETGVFSVDNFAIYSDTAGTTEVFSDDFEAYAEGDSLDTDNAVSPYNSSTSEAIVGVE